MESRRLKGKVVRDTVLAELSAKAQRAARPAGLGVILVGDDPASRIYVRHKTKACAEAGFHQVTHRFGPDATEEEVIDCIEALNRDANIDGILVQLPLPPHLSAERVLMKVDPRKDVDGFHPENLGLLMAGHPRFVPCTPKGILRLLKHYQIRVTGKRVAIVGRSMIVGRPLALLLALKREDGNATVTLCHTGTVDLPGATRTADIVVAAMGASEALTREHIGRGTVIIDVGMNRVPDPAAKSGTRLVGDVAAEALDGWASAYTPVPGGVGPMTIAMLLENTWEAFAHRETADD